MNNIIGAILKFAGTTVGKRVVGYLLSQVVEDAFNNMDISSVLHTVLSDENLKDIRGKGGDYSIDEVALMLLDDSSKGTNPEDSTDVSDDYAKHMYNYTYTYKDDATNIDSSIDPNEEHIGVMAQDIEKINPACITTLPNGVKTVNTDRLALMNAGVIADLARRLEALEGNHV